MAIGALLGGIGALAGAGISAINLGMQSENYKYQKELQKNQMQWKVNDLKKAGLSPVLATGGASGGVVQTQAPQMSDPSDKIATVMNLIQMEQNIAQSKAQEALLRNQKTTEITKQLSNVAKMHLDNSKSATENYNRSIHQKVGTPTNSGAFGSVVAGGTNVIKKSLSEMLDNAGRNIGNILGASKDALNKAKKFMQTRTPTTRQSTINARFQRR